MSSALKRPGCPFAQLEGGWLPIHDIIGHQHRPPHALFRHCCDGSFGTHWRGPLRQGEGHSRVPSFRLPLLSFCRFSPFSPIEPTHSPPASSEYRPFASASHVANRPPFSGPQDSAASWTLLAAGIRLYLDAKCNTTIPLFASRAFAGVGARQRTPAPARATLPLTLSRSSLSRSLFHICPACHTAFCLLHWIQTPSSPRPPRPPRTRGHADGLEVFGSPVLQEEAVTAVWPDVSVSAMVRLGRDAATDTKPSRERAALAERWKFRVQSAPQALAAVEAGAVYQIVETLLQATAAASAVNAATREQIEAVQDRVAAQMCALAPPLQLYPSLTFSRPPHPLSLSLSLSCFLGTALFCFHAPALHRVVATARSFVSPRFSPPFSARRTQGGGAPPPLPAAPAPPALASPGPA